MAKKKYRRYSPEFKRHALKRASEDGVTDVPACGYRTQDMIDDGIDDDISKEISNLSSLVNNPSAEGLLTVVKTFPTHSPPS